MRASSNHASHGGAREGVGTITGWKVDPKPGDEGGFWWEAYGPQGAAVGSADDEADAEGQARAAMEALR